MTQATIINNIRQSFLYNLLFKKMPDWNSATLCRGAVGETGELSMLDGIIREMESSFCKGIFTQRKSFRFVVGDAAATVVVDAESYSVTRDETALAVDCYCRTSAEMFGRIWYDGYRPGIMDFLSGAIECDNPLLLPRFLRAFGK